MMSKTKRNKMAVVALTMCATLCVGAAVGVNVNKNFATASAETAKYAVTVADNYSANVSQTSPATITLTGVTAGQYSISAKITAVDGKPIADDNWEFYDLVATVGGESLYLNYDFGNRTFNGVIRVATNDTLTLTTTTSSTLTLSITVDNLSIGANNDYTLSNVVIPAGASMDITLDNVAASDYKVIIDLGMEDLIGNGALYAQVNDGDAVKLTKDSNYFSNTYVGTVTVKAASTTLTIISDNSADLNATIMLNQVMTYAELPASVDLEMWMAKTYKYTATDTGYFSLNTSSADSMADVSITFKNDPEAFEGLNVTENNYPLYMEAGETYYFEFVLMNSSNYTNATIYTAVEDWGEPTIEADIAYPVPVTAEGRDKAVMDLNIAEGTYELSIMEVPFMYYMMGVTVTAYIDGLAPIYLTPANGYATKVDLSNKNTSIYLTTGDAESTVLSLYIATPEVRNTINLKEATTITVPGATYDEEGTLIPGNAIYYLENVLEGYYTVMLSNLANGAIVSVDANWIPAVFKGHTNGGFKVSYDAEIYDSIEVVIEFYNYNTEETNFSATLDTIAGNYDLALGTNSIAIKEGYTVYYLEGLASGNYELAVANLPAGATITVDGVALTFNGDKATFKVSEDQDNRGLVTVMFMSNAAANVTVTVTPLNVMMFNEAMDIMTVGDYYNTAYYINLEAGTYSIQLNTPDGMYVNVMANGEYAVAGGQMGVFTVKESGLVALRFTVSNYSGVNTFKAIVTNLDGTMYLGAAEKVTLPAGGFGKVYTLSGYVYGEFNIEGLTDAVKVYVNGYLVEGTSFYNYDSTCTIAFVNSGDEEVTLNVTVTPANTITLGTTEITIGYWEYSKTLYIELEEGFYNIKLTLSDGTMIQVSVDGVVYIASGKTEAEIYTEGGYLALTFESNTFEEVTFTVEITEA